MKMNIPGDSTPWHSVYLPYKFMNFNSVYQAALAASIIFKQLSVIYQLTIQMCQDPTNCVCRQYFHSPSQLLDGSQHGVTSFKSPSISGAQSIQSYRYPPWASPQPPSCHNHFNSVQPSWSSHFMPIIPLTPPSQPYFHFENTYQQTFSNAKGHFQSPLANATGTEVNGGRQLSTYKRKSGSASKQTLKKCKTGKAMTACEPEPEVLFSVGPSIPISNADGSSNTDAPCYGSLVTECKSSRRSTTLASDMWYFTEVLETGETPTRPPPNATFHKTWPKITYLGCCLCVSNFVPFFQMADSLIFGLQDGQNGKLGKTKTLKATPFMSTWYYTTARLGTKLSC